MHYILKDTTPQIKNGLIVIKMLVWLVYTLIAIPAPEQQVLGYVHICTAIKYITECLFTATSGLMPLKCSIEWTIRN